MIILVDKREQAPFDFSGFGATVQQATLQSGDYSLYGLESRVAVERKALSDLLGCLTHDRDRFLRELDRLRGYESAVVVVEAPHRDIVAGKYRSKMPPDAAEQSIISIMQDYRLPFYFGDDRADAARFTYHFLRHAHRHAVQRYKALSAGKI